LGYLFIYFNAEIVHTTVLLVPRGINVATVVLLLRIRHGAPKADRDEPPPTLLCSVCSSALHTLASLITCPSYTSPLSIVRDGSSAASALDHHRRLARGSDRDHVAGAANHRAIGRCSSSGVVQ